MHELCYSKLGAAVNKLIPQMTSSTGTKVVDHPAIDALRRRTHSTNCLLAAALQLKKSTMKSQMSKEVPHNYRFLKP